MLTLYARLHREDRLLAVGDAYDLEEARRLEALLAQGWHDVLVLPAQVYEEGDHAI